MAWCFVRALTVALVASVAASEQPNHLQDALALDDECQSAHGEVDVSCGLNALQLRGQALNSTARNRSEEIETIRILHLSDTHNLHNSIEDNYPLPAADILIHTGDFTNKGTAEEFESANAWLGTLKSRYKHILAITGNHDWITSVNWVNKERVSPAYANDAYWQKRLSNANYLVGGIEVMGINIFASPWKGEQHPSSPDGLGPVPSGVDILMVHGPPRGILDWTGGDTWGSSVELLDDISKQKPKMVLFGHVHEQRGLWRKDNVTGDYLGGVEYELKPFSGINFSTDPNPPSRDLATQVISNNAMMNAPGKDGAQPHICGPARLIIARKIDGAWQFHVGEESA